MKRAIKTILHGTLLFGGIAVAIVVGNVWLRIAIVPVAVTSAAKLSDDLRGNEIKDSVFSVSSDGKIVENPLAKPLRLFKLLGKKSSFNEETVNMFVELKEKDDNGNKIEYSTVSHTITKRLLEKLEENEYIEDLEIEETKKSRLFFAKLLMGKLDLSGKKKRMFNMSFKLTDKERTIEDLMNLDQNKKTTNEEEIVDNSKEVKNEEDRNKEIEEQLRILKNYREELENRDLVEEKKSNVTTFLFSYCHNL